MTFVRRALFLSLGLLAPLTACGAGPVQSADLNGGGFVRASSSPAPWGKSLSGNYLAGRQAERSFDFGEAADRLTVALARDPTNVTLRQRVFLLQLSDGRLDESLRSAKALQEAKVALPLVTLRLALEAVRTDDFGRAKELVASLDPTRYQAFMRPAGLAWLKLADGDGIEAALAALDSLSAEPGFAALHLLHQALLNDSAGAVEAAQRAFEALLERDPTPSLRILQLAGNFFERRGSPQRARALYDAYRRENARSTLFIQPVDQGTPAPLIASPKQGFAEAVFDLAGALYEDRDVALSLIYARMAQALAPEDAMIALLIGEILEAEDRHAEALKVYGRIDPASPFGRAAALRMAQTLDEQEETEKAIASLRALAASHPNDPEPLAALGHILRARERFDEAVVAYDEAFARMPELQPRDWSLLYARGIALERSGQWQRAEADLKKALEFEPDQPYVLNYLGYSWVDQGINLAEAEKLVQRAVDLRPNDGFIADSLGWVYFRTGRFEKAIELLERAVSLEPGDPVLNEHLGDAYWKVGRRNEARFQGSHALTMNPEKKRVAELQAKVQCGLGCQAKASGL